MKLLALVFILLLQPFAAVGQQSQNIEIQPNGTGGYSGTYGRRNFDMTPDYSRPVPRGLGRRFHTKPPEVVVPNEGVTGNTLRRCYTTGNENTICR